MNDRNILTIIIVTIIFIYSAIFIVDERQVVIKFRLGEIVASYTEPGLYFMIPFINNIKKYDSRILTIHDVVSGDRAELMIIVKNDASVAAKALGITVVDVRLKKVNLPDEVSASVYARMVKERATVAKAFRSKGKETAQGITATAERESETIIAEAYKQAQEIKGEGDAVSAETYAKSYNLNPEFYSFYRSLSAYKSSFNAKEDVMIIQPDSDFFKYFKDPKGKK